MGIDLEIYVKADPDVPFFDVHGQRFGGARRLVEGYAWYPGRPEGATHYVETMHRYFAPDYQRGDWPEICGCLLGLLHDTGVEKVWYGGDSIDGFEVVDLDFINRYNRAYVNRSEE